MNFQICEFLPLFGPPYHALSLPANFEPRTYLTKSVILHPFDHYCNEIFLKINEFINYITHMLKFSE